LKPSIGSNVSREAVDVVACCAAPHVTRKLLKGKSVPIEGHYRRSERLQLLRSRRCELQHAHSMAVAGSV
jgi:hypothetical protein